MFFLNVLHVIVNMTNHVVQLVNHISSNAPSVGYASKVGLIVIFCFHYIFNMIEGEKIICFASIVLSDFYVQ